MSDYDIADSEGTIDSGSEQKSPELEQYVDYMPLEQMQGSRRRQPNAMPEARSR